MPEININFPTTSFLLEDVSGVKFYVQLSGAVHVAVPEPSTWCLLIVGSIGLGLVRIRHASRKMFFTLLTVGLSFSVGGLAQAQPPVNSSWLDASDGNWIDTSHWSTNPVFPNNDTPTLGTTYEVLIDAMGADYTVTLEDDISVDRITINSNNATLQQDGGELNVGTIDIQQGAYHVRSQSEDARIIGATIGGDGVFTLDRGRLVDTTIAADSVMGIALVEGDLTLDNSVMSLRFIDFDYGGISGNQLDGNGTLRFENPYGTGTIRHSEAGGRLTIAPDIRIESTTGFGEIIGQYVVNQGTIRSGAGTRLDIEARTFVNQGEVAIGGMTAIGHGLGTWRNEGAIRIESGGQLEVRGTVTVDDLGTIIDESENAIRFIGVLDNRGQTLDLSGLDLNQRLSLTYTGRIRGGVLPADINDFLDIDYGCFEGVTLAGDLALDEENDTLNVSGGLALQDNITLTMGTRTELLFEGNNVNLNGQGTVLLDPDSTTGVFARVMGDSLIIGPDVTIRNGTNPNNALYMEFQENQGTIVAESPGGMIRIDKHTFSNNGVIRAVDGVVQFDGNYTLADLGEIQFEGGQIQLEGSLDNTGTTIIQDAASGPWGFRGSITGGRIESTEGVVSQFFGRMTNVTIAGPAEVLGLRVDESLTLDNAQLTLSTGSSLSIGGDGPVSLDGNGIIVLNGASGSARIETYSSSYLDTTDLVVGSGIIIKSAPGKGGRIRISDGDFINHGTLSAESEGAMIEISNGLHNLGLMQSVDHATLRVFSDNWVNEGKLHIESGGILELLGEDFKNGANGEITGNGTIYLGRSTDPDLNLQWQSPTNLEPVATDADAYTNLGTIAPGPEFGTLLFEGNLMLGETSVLEIELGDGVNDMVSVSGLFNLNGMLDVVLAESFVPRIGDVFEIIRGDLNGMFDNAQGTLPIGEVEFGVTYLRDAVLLTTLSFANTESPELQAVPEPSTWALMLSGLLIFGWKAPRRNRRARTCAHH